MDIFRFKKLDYTDLPLLHTWYNTSHVQACYASRPLEFHELETKYLKYISQHHGIKGFICYHNNQPIGYIQYYSIKRHQWLDVDLKDYLNCSAGIDVFIGEVTKLGQGLGSKMIKRFLSRHVFREYDYCFVDPMFNNLAAISCYKKSGFIYHQDVFSDEGVPHQLLMKHKSSLKQLVNSKRKKAQPQNSGNQKKFVRDYIADAYLYWRNKAQNNRTKTR